jgi:hypothetical protein
MGRYCKTQKAAVQEPDMLNWQEVKKNVMIKAGSPEPGKELFYGT